MGTKYCKLEGCGKEIDKGSGFGLCQMHYRRMDAVAATGDPDKRKCVHCKELDDQSALYRSPGHVTSMYHKACAARKYQEGKAA